MLTANGFQVSVKRRIDCRARAAHDVQTPRKAVHILKIQTFQPMPNFQHIVWVRGNVIRYAVHEANVAAILHDMKRVT